MNISIDTSTASPTSLRLTAAVLTFVAGFKENPQNAGLPIPLIIPPPAVPPVVAPVPPAAVSPAAERPEVPFIPAALPVPGSNMISQERFENGEDVPTALLDSSNEPWNPEIHTANQSKNTDGTWRRRRTPKGEVPAAPKTVELPKAPQIPPPPPPPVKFDHVESYANAFTQKPPAPSVVVEPVKVVPPAPTSTGTVPDTTTAVPPAPPVSTVSTSPLAEFGGDTFASLVKYATNLVGAKKLSTTAMLEACAECGVPDIHACSKPENAALIPAVAIAISKRLPK